MDSNVIATWIERVDAALAANRPAYYAALQPGVTDADLDEFERRFSLRLPGAIQSGAITLRIFVIRLVGCHL